MAKIGLKYIVGAKYNVTNNAVSYTDGLVLGKGISVGITIGMSDVKLYADDAIAESIKDFQSGTISIGLDELDNNALAFISGHTADSTNGEIIKNISDVAPYIGVGFYGAVIRNGVRKIRCVWLPRTIFSIPANTFATKADSPAFTTPTMEGEILADIAGNWEIDRVVATEDEAVEWLNGKAGI